LKKTLTCLISLGCLALSSAASATLINVGVIYDGGNASVNQVVNQLNDSTAYSFNAEAVEASQLISFPLPILKEAIMSDGTLSYNMLSGMSRRRQQQDLEIEHRTVQNASQRIGCFLLRLCKPDMASPIRLNLPYDKMLLASRLGMKPETFSRALNRLRKETDIRITGATIEFDSLSQLSTYSCSACSTAFPCVDHH
jgi:CRP-like cAMP-binding protein